MKVLSKALTRLHLPLQSCLCPQPGETLGKMLSRFFRLHKAEPEREREGEVVTETKKERLGARKTIGREDQQGHSEEAEVNMRWMKQTNGGWGGQWPVTIDFQVGAIPVANSGS